MSGVFARIFSEYKCFEKQPIFSISDNDVIVTLFNRNYQEQENVGESVGKNGTDNVRLTKTAIRQECIISEMTKNSLITATKLSILLNVS